MLHPLRVHPAPLVLVLFCCWAGSSPVYAQEEPQAPTITFVEETAAGNVRLAIDGAAYTALPDSIIRRINENIARLEQRVQTQAQQLAAQDTMMAALDRTVAAYQETFRLQEGLVARTTALYEGYRDLSALYERHHSEPLFNISGGLGAMRAENNDVIPGVLVGLSVRRLSLWGFVNQRQTGFIIGLNQPIEFGIFR